MRETWHSMLRGRGLRVVELSNGAHERSSGALELVSEGEPSGTLRDQICFFGVTWPDAATAERERAALSRAEFRTTAPAVSPLVGGKG